VNAEGELVDFLVVAYTRKAFAEEAERTIRQWKFEPEYSGDQPLDTILDITFNFEVTGVLLVQRYGADPLPSTPLENYEYQACSLKYLDRIPTPVAIVRPTYPSEWAEKGIVGQVVVDFYIDETGRTRFAAVPSGANELLAGITVPAVSQWRFSPPTRHGSPVLVHAQQIFDFRKDSAAAK
jgi:TonB family protein